MWCNLVASLREGISMNPIWIYIFLWKGNSDNSILFYLESFSKQRCNKLSNLNSQLVLIYGNQCWNLILVSTINTLITSWSLIKEFHTKSSQTKSCLITLSFWYCFEVSLKPSKPCCTFRIWLLNQYIRNYQNKTSLSNRPLHYL